MELGSNEGIELGNYGGVMVTDWRVTSVCANIRPFKDEPVLRLTPVLDKMMPSKCAPASTSTSKAADQKMFFASAPPVRVTLMFVACTMFRDVLMMNISVALPENVR